MPKSTVRPTEDEIEITVKTFANMLFQLCFTILCNRADAEDAVSDTFIKYITKSPSFHDEEHKKAWLIRVATNTCKDLRRFQKRHTTVNLDEIDQLCAASPERNILEEVMGLSVKYKTVLYLYYIAGYSTKEIAQILSISPAAVRKRLQYGRKQLKLEYGKGEE